MIIKPSFCLRYCFAKDKKTKDIYLISSEFVDKLGQLLSTEFWIMYTFDGELSSKNTFCTESMFGVKLIFNKRTASKKKFH